MTSHTKRYVRCFWGLDRGRAQARFYPAIHPLQSYSEDADTLGDWWTGRGNPNWRAWRERLLVLLEEQANLERMARIVGKDALPPGQQVKLLCADLVGNAFLRQSAYSEVDRYCSPERQTAMLGALIRFFDLAEEAVADGVAPDDIASADFYRRMSRMSEEIGEGEIEKFGGLVGQMERELAALERSLSDVV
ncbi:MAG: hypothetical protein R3D85_14780 [Paracoccaceae bacterium]